MAVVQCPRFLMSCILKFNLNSDPSETLKVQFGSRSRVIVAIQVNPISPISNSITTSGSHPSPGQDSVRLRFKQYQFRIINSSLGEIPQFSEKCKAFMQWSSLLQDFNIHTQHVTLRIWKVARMLTTCAIIENLQTWLLLKQTKLDHALHINVLEGLASAKRVGLFSPVSLTSQHDAQSS